MPMENMFRTIERSEDWTNIYFQSVLIIFGLNVGKIKKPDRNSYQVLICKMISYSSIIFLVISLLFTFTFII